MSHRFGNGQTLRSLSVRNFRLYLGGLFTSQVGNWMTRIAQTLLVLSVTDGSGIAIGVLAIFQYGPVVILGAWSGAVTDRSDKRRMLLIVQALAGLQSLTLAILVALDLATLPVICAVAAIQGCLNSFDNPCRRAFVSEIVPSDYRNNAISLNTATMTASRAIGPALAGVIVVTAGFAWCFLIDAISYVAVLLGLVLIRPSEIDPVERVAHERGQVREGIRYINGNHGLRVPLVMMAIVTTLAWTFTVSFPLLVKESLDGSDGDFTTLFTVLSLGSVAGALYSARRDAASLRQLQHATVAFGVGMATLMIVPNLAAALPAALLIGFASSTFMVNATTVLQVLTAPAFRGRVSSIQTMVFQGSIPLGSLIIGIAAAVASPRLGVAIGACGCLIAVIYSSRATRNSERAAPEHTAIDLSA